MSEFNNNYHSGYEPENDSVSGSFSRPNTNSYSSSRYNSFSDSSGYTNFNQQGTANEFYYSPHKPSASKGKKAIPLSPAITRSHPRPLPAPRRTKTKAKPRMTLPAATIPQR